MFKCLDCEHVFDEPKRINADDYYGVSGMFESRSTTYYDVCPECEGAIEEATQCEICGEYFTGDELTDTTEYINGGCGDCCEQCIEDGGMICL